MLNPILTKMKNVENGHVSNLTFDASPEIKAKAKELRKRMTHAEVLLWERIRNNKTGYKFRRQHPISIFIADFYCHEKKLVIEVDGMIHEHPDQKEYDIGREIELENLGIKVVRFTNYEVENNIEGVIEDILNIIARI